MTNPERIPFRTQWLCQMWGAKPIPICSTLPRIIRIFRTITLFLQGNPFPHLEPGMGPRELGALAIKLAARGMHFKGLAYYTLKCDHLGCPHQMKDPQNKGKWAGWNKDIPVGRIYQELFQGPVALAVSCQRVCRVVSGIPYAHSHPPAFHLSTRPGAGAG